MEPILEKVAYKHKVTENLFSLPGPRCSLKLRTDFRDTFQPLNWNRSHLRVQISPTQLQFTPWFGFRNLVTLNYVWNSVKNAFFILYGFWLQLARLLGV